jgi:hypothetical protein
MVYFIACIVMGIAIGIFSGFYSCQNHIRGAKNQEAATLIGPTSIFGGVFGILTKLAIIESECLLVFISSSVCASAASFFVFLYLASKNKERPKSLSYRFFYSKSDEFKKLIEDSNRQISMVKHQIGVLNTLKKDIDDAKTNAICLELPVGEQIPINDLFIKQIPNMFKNVVSFINCMNKFENKFYEELKVDQLTVEGKEQKFFELLNSISKHLSENLFNINDVRIHFRYFNIENYDQLTVYSCSSSLNEPLTRIPLHTDSLISKAALAKRSLIKSVNGSKEGFNYITKHSYKWVEYFTLVFDKFFEEDTPMITMGISLTSADIHKNELYFINYCKIEDIIQNYLESFNSRISINSIIANIRNSRNQDLA